MIFLRNNQKLAEIQKVGIWIINKVISFVYIYMKRNRIVRCR